MLDRARRRCADLTIIEFLLARGLADGFDRPFDLIVLSEIVYYWGDPDIALVGAAIDRWLEPGGRVLLVHWLAETNNPQTADDAVSALHGEVRDLRIVRQARRAAYRLDLWRRADQARRMTA